MVYRRATWLPHVLRGAGLEVVLVHGWESRGLDGGDFTPRALVLHHDASPVGDSPGVVEFMLRNFDTGAAQCWLSRQGVWHVLASGRCAHAGVVLPGMPDNSTSLAVECDHTSNERWPGPQLDSLRVGSAAILGHLGRDASALHFHKTICAPPGRKTDPDGLSLDHERAAVAELLTEGWDQMATRSELREVIDAAIDSPAFKNAVRLSLEAERAEIVDAVTADITSKLANTGTTLSTSLRNNVRVAVDAELSERNLGV